MTTQASRRLTRRTSFLTLAAVTGGTLLAACGEPTVRYVGKPRAGPPGPAGPQGSKGEAGAKGVAGEPGAAGKTPVKLEHWIGLPRKHPEGEANHRAVEDAVEELADKYNVVVTVTSVSKVTDKVVVSAAGGTPPNTAWVPYWDGARLFAPGMSVDPDEELKSVKGWPAQRKDIFPGMINTVLWRGKLTSLPTNTNNRGIYYDKNVLKKAGVSPPGKTWTLKEFEEKITKASHPPEYWGFTYGKHLEFLIFYGGAGGKLMNPEQTKWTLDNEIGRNMLQWIHDLAWKRKVVPAPPPGEMMRKGEGKVAFDITGNFRLPTLRKVGVDAGAAPMPLNKVPYTMAHGWTIAIMKVQDKAVQHAAGLFAMWVNSPGWQVPFIVRGAGIPVSGASLNDKRYQDYLAQDPVVKVFADQAPVAWRVPTFPSGRKSEKEFGKFIVQAYKNEIGLAEALEQGQRAAQIVLDNDLKQYQ